MGQLTATRIKTLTEPGRYIDGEVLMMEIAPGGSRSWKLRVRVDGKRRDFGLGSLSICLGPVQHVLEDFESAVRRAGPRAIVELGEPPVRQRGEQAVGAELEGWHRSEGDEPGEVNVNSGQIAGTSTLPA